MSKRRYIIAGMLFMVCFTNYILRTNMTLLLNDIVINMDAETNQPDHGPRFSWPLSIYEGLICSFFYGYTITSLLGGTLAEKFGGKNVIGISILIASLLTIMHPACAGRMYPELTIILRFLIGLALGFCYPACHALISKWSPPDEKFIFLIALMGGPFSTPIILPLTNLLVQQLDWRLIFYLEGLFSIIIVIIWFIVVTDDPNQNRFIQPDEKLYITESIVNTVTEVEKMPPFLKIFTSIPFIALIFLHFGNIWGLTFILYYAPKYFGQIFDSNNLYKISYIPTIPNLMRFIMAILFGILADMLRRRNILSVTKIRHIFCITSHILPSIFLMIITFGLDEESSMVILMLTLSLGFNGSAILTNIQNCHDLAPNYAGTLFGIMNFFGNTSGFLESFLIDHMITDKVTIERDWNIVIFITASIYIFTAVLFIFWGTGEIQNWNFRIDENENEIESK